MSQSQNRDQTSWRGTQSNENEHDRNQHQESNQLALAAIAAMGAQQDINLSLNMDINGQNSSNTLSLIERMVSEQRLHNELLQHFNAAKAMISRPIEQVITVAKSGEWLYLFLKHNFRL